MLSGFRKSVAAWKRGSFASLLLAALLVALSAVPAHAATLLYPNLKTLAPRDLRLDTTDVDASEATVTHNVLRFSNTTWNSGPGKLEMRSLIDPKTKAGPAIQRVYDDSGGSTDFAAGNFYYHAAHAHYHYDDWGRYELWTKADYDAWLASGKTKGTPTVGSKTTSCMIDEEFIRSGLPNQPYPEVYGTGGCFPDGQGKMLQGISPGWGDTYDYFRFEQWIDLGPSGSLPDGQYVLRSVADPVNKVYESPGKADSSRESAEDNEAITIFGVQKGQLADTNPPTGTVRINNIDAATTSPSVTVRVLGRDDISGVTQLRLSNDGSAWSTPQAYTGKESTAQAIGWDLTNVAYGGNNADGTKTVYVQFKDVSGKWSASETDTILLDRGGGSSPYSNVVLSDGPSGYWRLGETSGTTASDAAGANPGSYKNGALLGQASLLPADSANRSVRFDGINDYVAIPSSSSLSPASKVSVEAWIKPNALPGAGNFASVASKPESYSLQFNGSRLEFTIIQSGIRRRLQAPAGAIAVGQAYHVLGTYDGTTQRLYVNGAEVAGTPLTGGIAANSNALNIASWNGGSEPFNGTIDDLAVYTNALSAARVAAHYQAALGGPPPDPTVKDPSGLEAGAVSDTRIDLKWVDNSTNEGEFLIQRDTSAGFGSPTTMGAWANSTTFSDTGLLPSTTYYYRVRARNATDSSGYSNTASATTQAPPPVKDPSNLAATAVSDTRIDLKWVDNSTNEGEFLIERDTSASFGSPTVTGVPANSTTFSDTGLSPSTTFYYRVRARNATDSSGYSNTVSATTQEPPPPPSENYREAVLADGPVSYWRLGETSGSVAVDEKGANPGSYKNGALLGQASLLPADSANRSVRFDGINDYVAIPSSSSLSPASKVSVEAWIKPNALPGAGNFASVAS
ncbi:MAG: LamG-like jellyroll fold domain-containing protein, partial [Solirubrobacterales bacterium]